MKAELETAIRERRALAADIDKTHKNLTQTSLVTNSVAVVSGAMSFLGLALAPVTAGGSLLLTASGQGLGTVAGAASLVTSILEYQHNKQAQAQVSSKLSAPDPQVKIAMTCAVEARKTIYNCGKSVKSVKRNIQALQVARAHPRLAAAAERLLATGHASTRTTRVVQRAFRGTPLAMGSKALLRSSMLAGLCLGMDLSSLLKDWKQLQQGARTQLADSLRAEAEELERQLAELTQLYERLQVRLEGGERAWGSWAPRLRRGHAVCMAAPGDDGARLDRPGRASVSPLMSLQVPGLGRGASQLYRRGATEGVGVGNVSP